MKHAHKRNFLYCLSVNNDLNHEITNDGFTHKNKLKSILINLVLFCILIFIYTRFISLYSKKSENIYSISLICFFLIGLIIIVGCNYLYFVKKYKLEKLFLIIMIPVSVIYSLILIPGMVPDENTHMRLTYSLASQIMQVERESTTLRGEEKYLYDRLPQAPNQDNYEYTYNNIFSMESNGEYIEINENSAEWKQIFGYFPAVLGVILGRTLHFGATPTFYLARFCNLIFYLWITYFAIKKIPVGKQLLFTITLLPMCSQQMMSLSYDAVLNSASFFCLSYGLYFVYNSEDVKWDEFVKYIFSGILLLSIKSAVYSFLLIIPILAQFKGYSVDEEIAKKQKMVIFLSLSIFILLLNFISFGNKNLNAVETSAVTDHIISWSGTPGYTVVQLISHPIQSIKMFFNSINFWGEWYFYSCLGQDLAWFTVKLNYSIFNLWFIVLFLSALKKEVSEFKIYFKLKLLFILLIFVVIFLVMLSMCLFWTPITYDIIQGVQGRYFIPILFLILILTNNQKLAINVNFYRYLNILSIILVVVTIINLIQVCFA